MRQTKRMRKVVIIILLLLAVGFVLMIRRGFSAHDEPTAIEAFIATRMRHWATPAALREARNPVPLTPAILAEARAHFADHCAICHGNDGKGQTGMHLYPPVPDLTRTTLSDGELFGVIENGIRMSGMPAFGNGSAESRRASWTLVHFIRHLPRITPEELGAMERLNPKTPEEWKEMQEEDSFLKGGRP